MGSPRMPEETWTGGQRGTLLTPSDSYPLPIVPLPVDAVTAG